MRATGSMCTAATFITRNDSLSSNNLAPVHAQVFNDESHRLNVYGSNVEVDYRGSEVTVENFIRVLTGVKCSVHWRHSV